jgi:diacylglycerol kinase family enzyme
VKDIVDGNEVYNGKANLVTVANGRFFGGGMMIAPDALIDDGKFDIVIFEDMTKLEFIRLSNDIYKGAHITRPKIKHLRGCEVTGETQDPMLLDVDGEQPGTTPARITILPSAINFKSI